MHIVLLWEKNVPQIDRTLFVCTKPPIFDVQKEERVFVWSLQRIWWQVRVFIFCDLEAQVHDCVRPFTVQPQNATRQVSVGEGTVVSAGLSIFNDGVKPSSCAIDPIRSRKEG